ncbi:type IV secretory system conjugative DNA transfer family protein [Streptomyces resistomycificus]|uniref:Type VI secretion protein n=1 Tax=Streptomyces resistomycificus TaxID=67356 RepID=A0A0L8L4Z1_9ACTN|nr:type IV secretory system conjugative DNA transfer family protein [Streptomyces resistomycificus]KOG33190.1 type VI secretion protein [Streptomyces resistomycificus]KUN96335.1 type VI secretion protein [Streptomyces resistomycificus]
MRPGDQRDRRQDGQGGIPDGLLVGILAFLLGMTLLVWSATGLAALFAHGSWPDGVTFTRAPLAIRHLVAQPHDIPGAWPDAPASDLSGYGLFWGLLIGQVMILIVLTVFVMGTVARWRAVRARRRVERVEQWKQAVAPEPVPVPTPEVHEVPVPRTEPRPEPTAVLQETAPAQSAPVGGWEANRPEGAVLYGPPETRRSTATQAVRDAEGPALVITSNPALWQDTKDARAKLGPVHVYDPTHLCDTPARLHWSPTTGCEDKQTAATRATALLAPVRPTARLDQAVSDTAETLLRSYLHAAAIDGRTIRHVHRWCQGTQIQDAVRTLRTNPKAAPGSAGELEAALTAHPERKDIAQELTSRALAALFTLNVREACTPNRTDALALDSFVDEGGTLYVVGESIEDPRTDPGAMPLLTALASSVVERGRRMAERSSSGRLDPPMTLVLDDVAAVAPLPQLPELLAAGPDRGLPTLALLRSREQARTRWPDIELPV